MTDTNSRLKYWGCWGVLASARGITRICELRMYSHLWLCCYLYATFCPPRFSIFFCLLLSASGAGAPPAAPPIPPNIPFIPPTVVAARYIEYPGTTRYNHQALSPNTVTSAMLIQVQYTMSHMNSVRPLASRSSPARRSEPSTA